MAKQNRTDIYAEHFRGSDKQWRWRIMDASNAHVLDQPSQGYSRKIDMRSTFRKLYPNVSWKLVK